jgi:hypothetical protein
MKVNLRGYALVADRELFDKESPQALHLLRDNVDIPSGQFVLIRTGRGEPRWSLTKDGRRIFCTYMQRDASVWGDCEGPIHLLRPQHSYCQRSTEAVSIR